ncbi:MAG: DUF6680 family protein [Geobacteraceae bacterium]|nr:DUF6680 family protein [Geobacteraceae bacterium]
MCVIDWTSLAIVFATLGGPFLAVWAADIRAEHRRLYNQKENVFHTLMATRGARMRFEHVAALNRIELAFPRLKHPNVVDTWELYLKHLGSEHSQSQNQEIFERWADTANDLFHNLLQSMATDLKIPFSKTSIKYNAYYPIGYERAESQNIELKQLLIGLLKNERWLNMNAVVYPASQSNENKGTAHNQEEAAN